MITSRGILTSPTGENMRNALKRGLIGLSVISLISIALGGPAHAADPPVARLTFSGNDAVSYGQSYAYTSTTGGTAATVAWNDASQSLQVDFTGHSEVPHLPQDTPSGLDSFSFALAAPVGKKLAVGIYRNTRATADAYYPGLRLSGNGRACESHNGDFTVTELTVVDGVITRLNVTFQHRCSGSAALTQGRLLIGHDDMPPLPVISYPVVSLDAGTRLFASLDTRSLVKVRRPTYRVAASGTITCAAGSTYTLSVHFTQGTRSDVALLNADCTGSVQPWSAGLVNSTDPFQAGWGEIAISATGRAPDEYYYFVGGLSTTLQQQVTLAPPMLRNRAAAGPAGAYPGGAAPVAPGVAQPASATGPTVPTRMPLRRH